MVKENSYFGGKGGKPFPMEFVHSIGIESDEYLLRGLRLNGEVYGSKGDIVVEKIMNNTEFINEVIIGHFKAKANRVKNIILSLTFKTNIGRTIEAGNLDHRVPAPVARKHKLAKSWGDLEVIYYTLSNIRVLGIGGDSDKYLDRIGITYIEDYIPSVQIMSGYAVIDVITPGTKLTTYSEEETKQISGYKKVLEKTFNISTKTQSKGLGEFIAKVAVMTESKSTSREEINKEMTQVLKEGRTKEFFPLEGEFGLEIVGVNVFKDTQNDLYWIAPQGSAPNIISVSLDSPGFAEDLFDLTGVLDLQIPNWRRRKEEKYNFDFYPHLDDRQKALYKGVLPQLALMENS